MNGDIEPNPTSKPDGKRKRTAKLKDKIKDDNNNLIEVSIKNLLNALTSSASNYGETIIKTISERITESRQILQEENRSLKEENKEIKALLLEMKRKDEERYEILKSVVNFTGSELKERKNNNPEVNYFDNIPILIENKEISQNLKMEETI